MLFGTKTFQETKQKRSFAKAHQLTFGGCIGCFWLPTDLPGALDVHFARVAIRQNATNLALSN